MEKDQNRCILSSSRQCPASGKVFPEIDFVTFLHPIAAIDAKHFHPLMVVKVGKKFRRNQEVPRKIESVECQIETSKFARTERCAACKQFSPYACVRGARFWDPSLD